MASAAGGAPPPAPACAACKYQRRRCTAECPLAQYFPQERRRVFRNAHRLFGVRNILKTLKRVGPDPGRRHEAMQCIVYESQAWDLYPAAGCVPIILALQQRIRQAEHQLRRVHHDLQAAYRRRPDDAGPFMYGGGGGDEQQQQQMMMMAMMMTNNEQQHQQQPIVVSTQLPELQDDMINYFADVGINNDGEENDKMMPGESSTDSSDEKAMKKGPNKMEDNNAFIKQDVASSSTLPAAAAANKS